MHCHGMFAMVALLVSALVMVGANSVITNKIPPLGSTSMNFAGIAVVVGSLAAWWLTDKARKATDCRQEKHEHHVLERQGGISVITRSKQMLQDKLETIKQNGPKKLQIIADFDMTLTSFRLPDGSRGMSTHGILERSGYLGAEFTERAKAIFNKYYPIEVDPNIPTAQKWAAMSEWWETTHKLLVERGLTKEDVRNAVAGGLFAFREGTQELLELLEQHEVPVLVFSAGIADVLAETFQQRLGRFGNLSIISNEINFDAAGRILGFKNKTIHIMNKGGVALDGTPHLSKVEGRGSVILLGDSLGDLRMADGLPSKDVALTVGFLNDKIEERREQYLEQFDLVIEGDGPMSLVVDHVIRHVISA